MAFVRDFASFWGVCAQRDTQKGEGCWLCYGSQFKIYKTIGYSPLQPVFQDEFIILSILPAGPCQDEELLLGLCYSQFRNLAGEKNATRPFQQRKPKACSCHFMPKASRKYRKYTGRTKVMQNPFPLRILLSTWFWSISTPEKLFSLSNLKRGEIWPVATPATQNGHDKSTQYRPSHDSNLQQAQTFFLLKYACFY